MGVHNRTVNSDSDLQTTLADMARDMRAMTGSVDVIDMSIKALLHHVDAADHAGVTLVKGNDVISVAPSSDVVRRGDELQSELGEGPCVDAIMHDLYVHSPDLSSEPRWPRWAPRVIDELGMRSMLCVQLFVHARSVGALSIYSQTPGAFTAADIDDAAHFAAHLAVAVANSQEIEQLSSAIVRRTTIGRAEGILIAQYGLDPQTVFAVMVRLSQERNIKLYAIAEEVCEKVGLSAATLGNLIPPAT